MTLVLPSPSSTSHLPTPSSSLISEGAQAGEDEQLCLLALVVTIFRKPCCIVDREEEKLRAMEIGWPTNVRHVAHVTFDRFHGFLGLPVEFEPEVPRRPPSASTNVFGVSAESMQCSFDSRGNSVPTILLSMQTRLYLQGGLQAEGIFRINAENSQEEHVRDQLNGGTVPDDIDVHCLAGLIKAWFRELPTGVLDSLTPEQVMQCHTEEECAHLVKHLPPTEAALFDWAINLMADAAQEEHHNKMNARNIAMVFAPNMTKMADPLIALMYAVQVMNFLKTLIEKALKDRKDLVIQEMPSMRLDPSNENGHQSSPLLDSHSQHMLESDKVFLHMEPDLDDACQLPALLSNDATASSTTQENEVSNSTGVSVDNQLCKVPAGTNSFPMELANSNRLLMASYGRSSKTRAVQLCNVGKGPKRVSILPAHLVSETAAKLKGSSIVSRINTRAERVEAWR